MHAIMHQAQALRGNNVTPLPLKVMGTKEAKLILRAVCLFLGTSYEVS